MLGKELRNALNNTWLNYALPIDELRRLGRRYPRREVRRPAGEPGGEEARPSHGPGPAGDRVGARRDGRTPAYVDQVRPGSPAAQAGIRPDDLIELVGDRLIQSCKALRAELESIDRYDRVQLTVFRGAGYEGIGVATVRRGKQVSP